MADRTQLSEAIDNAIQALEELKRVWEAQQEAAAAAPAAPAPAPEPARSSSPSAVPAGRVCPGCGQPVAAGSKFCVKCGTPVPLTETAPPAQAPHAEVKFCTKCGNRLESGTRFCTKCGTPVS